MCGRITQYRNKLEDYVAGVGWPAGAAAVAAPHAAEHAPQYNVPPGSHPWLMQVDHDGRPSIDRAHWGYRPSWADERGMPMAINARVEKAATGRYFRPLWKRGRAIVPADGWYEWTGEKGHKQPWYIHLSDGGPMYLAALTNVKPGTAEQDDHAAHPDIPPAGIRGFVIVTAAADAGLLDVHDRRPVVLSPDDARLWMDPELPVEQAEHLARAMALPPEAFHWHEVGTEVNRVGRNGPELIAPMHR